MSPLAPSGARGYADYQRLDNWDSGVLWNEATGIVNTQINSPVLDVSRYAYLTGYAICGQNGLTVQIQWTMDAAQQVLAGSRSFTLTQPISGPMQFRIPNLGPFAQLLLTPFGGAAYSLNVNAGATNRVHPLEFIPANPAILDGQGVALPASGTVITYPTDYYAGPLSIDFTPGVAAWLTLDVLTSAGAWHRMYLMSGAAGSETVFTWVTPPGAWRMNVINQGAAASTFGLRAVPSMTGSS